MMQAGVKIALLPLAVSRLFGAHGRLWAVYIYTYRIIYDTYLRKQHIDHKLDTKLITN